MNYIASNINKITKNINNYMNSSQTHTLACKRFDNVYWAKVDRNG